MNNFAFEDHVARCTAITESTSYLEMFSYSNPSLNSVAEHPLPSEEFENFLHRRGVFCPAILPENVHPLAGVRLILQSPARHPETFAPNRISMKHEDYKAMIKALHLPRLAIETTTVVGLYFWYALDIDDDRTPYLHMVFRKSDVRKRGFTKGWELILSHEFKTGMTNGFAKGTDSSTLSDCIKHLKTCSSELGHAMLLPLIQFSSESSPAADIRQRNAREWLRVLEHAIAMRDKTGDGQSGPSYLASTGIDLNAINRDLVECQSQVLWNRPASYLAVIDSIEEAAQVFMQMLPDEGKRPAIKHFQRAMAPRLNLHRKRWNGIEVYANTTMQRLETQRSAVSLLPRLLQFLVGDLIHKGQQLYNVMALKESKLNLQMAGEQRRLAQSSKREAGAMKGISLLGAVFLPGAFLASIFSTSFFNFRDAPDMASVISPRFWLYWAVAIPFTVLIVALYFKWQRRRERRHAGEDADIEGSIEQMETQIMEEMRKRTISKVRTWNVRVERKAQLAADEDNDYGASKGHETAASNILTVNGTEVC